MLSIRRARASTEDGFTLIELLVVIVIIGILAAIAVPVFLAQRHKAYDSAATADLKGMATAQEAHLTDHDVYTKSVADLRQQGFRSSDGVTGLHSVTTGPAQYCLQVTSRSGDVWVYTSADPVAERGSC